MSGQWWTQRRRPTISSQRKIFGTLILIRPPFRNCNDLVADSTRQRVRSPVPASTYRQQPRFATISIAEHSAMVSQEKLFGKCSPLRYLDLALSRL